MAETEQELLSSGWSRCFIADEPRLSEAVAAYEEIGFEVRLLPVPADDSLCTECMMREPERYRIIFTRKEQVMADNEIQGRPGGRGE